MFSYEGCAAGYRRNGANCEICPPDTYNTADDTSATCTSCTSPEICIVAILGCIAGYKRNGANCEICQAETYNANDDTSTSCTPCGSGESTGGLTGQSSCTGYFT